MPNVFLDTDVALDIISKREPHYALSIKLMRLAAEEKITLIVAECSLGNLLYLVYDIYKIEKASIKLLNFLLACDIASGGKNMVANALNSDFKDKEDALQYFTAIHAGADYFITRNTADYKHARHTLPVYSPVQFMELSNSLKL